MELEAGEWLSIYANTHDGLRRIEWPDGGYYQIQLQIVVEIFSIIRETIRDYQDEKREK
jgi:hypothetical protein